MYQGETGEATWFLSDHLGSTSLTVDEGGGVLAARRYDPWGSPRDPEDLDDLLTDYTYTGQRSEAALGLMYYVARWYDSGIGHFAQADTIVPGAGNPAAWNRYGYVMYNPLKYTDPSGHSPSWCADNPGLPGCNGELEERGGGELPGNGESSLPGNGDATPTPNPSSTPSPPTNQTPVPIPVQTPLQTPDPNLILNEEVSPFALSIAVDVSGGIGFGGVSGIGIVFKDGVHVFTEIGETNEIPGELTIGIGAELEWDTETLADFEGEDVGVEVTYAVGWGGSVGVSLEPGGGFLDFAKINGLSFSIELGGAAAGGSVSYTISYKDVLDY